jgi:hypothetical protein
MDPNAGTRRERSSNPPTERVVDSVVRALAVVPSLRSSAVAWRQLGFECGAQFVFQGCRAFDVTLRAGGVRFLCADPALTSTPLAEGVARRASDGAGLIGWTWGCRSPERSRTLIERLGGIPFATTKSGKKSFVVPEAITAGALTLLEPATDEPGSPSPTAVDRIDHLVLMVGDADATVSGFAVSFGLRPRARDMKNARYAFCKIGDTVIEVVGPKEPRTGDGKSKVWGVTFESRDLDRTVATLRANAVEVPDPHPAIQGGRIVSLPSALDGIEVAFIGR